MRQVPKTELSPDNGCVIDTKWKVGPLSYHACAAAPKDAHGKPLKEMVRLPEIVVYDHIGFKGAYARTNLSFHYLGDFWNDRISCSLSSAASGVFIATNITRAITGISVRVFTKASSPKPARTTSSAPSKPSR